MIIPGVPEASRQSGTLIGGVPGDTDLVSMTKITYTYVRKYSRVLTC